MELKMMGQENNLEKDGFFVGIYKKNLLEF